jgi:hypothetical protein
MNEPSDLRSAGRWPMDSMVIPARTHALQQHQGRREEGRGTHESCGVSVRCGGQA